MKKIIIFLFIFVVCAVLTNGKKGIIIPDNAIRFRIIANSNSEYDQKVKIKVKNSIEAEIYKLIQSAASVDEARLLINNNMDYIDDMMKGYDVEYDIKYGNNYFPVKEYKGITYKAGNYESLVITLGDGVGENWWCVLFPPLCLLDEKDNFNNIEYTTYAEKLINKFK